jgi:hypothetical protein
MAAFATANTREPACQDPAVKIPMKLVFDERGKAEAERVLFTNPCKKG